MAQRALELLRVRDFRNLRELELAPGARFNVVSGDNGQGKSNLLEAIDYLGSLQSFRGARAVELIREDAGGAELWAKVASDLLPHEHRVRLSREGRREVQLDGKRPRSGAVYLQALPVVLFHPGDLYLTLGSADARRGFLDRLLVRLDAVYASALATYTRALASRNRLLKQETPSRKALAAYDEILASAGAVVGQARAALCDELAPRVVAAFAEISAGGPEVGLAYEPRVPPTVATLRAALQAAYDKDLARGFTADGPHADELAVRLRETRARRYASQGQHRAIVLALKIAELIELEQRTGHTPLLLLDDVSSELDRDKSRRFFALLNRLGGQVFLTTTRPDVIAVEGERRDFRVEAGVVTETS
ncbi:MAG TPA: DNA replication/repair protein RecF [Polyangiales bacterium]|nr:DNA replication/repair protein RecF [Polyangiales bacterium]